MVWMNNQAEGACARPDALKTIHSADPAIVVECLKNFLLENLPAGELPDLLLSGENGDERMMPYYSAVEAYFPSTIPVARFKHCCGEYCTASSFACWLSIQIIKTGLVSPLLVKKNLSSNPIRRILIYNNFREIQHAFLMVSKVKIKK